MAELIGGATATLTIGGVDLSDHISSATLEKNADEVETTAFGDASRTLIGGLQSGVRTINCHQDYAASEVDAADSECGGCAADEFCHLISPPVGAWRWPGGRRRLDA